MRLLDAALAAAVAGGADVFGGDFKAWCALNKVPRSTAYRHKKRVEELGRWVPASTRPRTRPGHQTPLEVEAEVVRLRGLLGVDNGAESIAYQLQLLAAGAGWVERGWRVPSRATIHKILVRHGLVVAEPKKKPKSSYRRFSYARPRDCYQIDGTQVRLAGGAKAVVMEVLDDCSRVLVATVAADAETAAAAITAVQRAFTNYGVPALVLSDNGSAFTSRLTQGPDTTSSFTRHVRAAGARLIHSSPYHPQTCGKVERHHRTFKTWLASQPAPATLTELQQLCNRYQTFYNTQRRHSAHNQPPRHRWDAAPVLGGPGQLPTQHDAETRLLVTTDSGNVQLGPTIIGLGRRYGSQRVTVLRDHDHITVYDPDGTPIGHLQVDFALPYQRLRPAA